MDELPFVLAGPIIRRVTPRSVSIWIALSESSTIKLSIWDREISTGSGFSVFSEPTSLHSASTDSIRIGNKLHLAIVTINLASVESLMSGKLYSYNLSFSGAAEPSDLKSNKLLEDIASSEEEPATNLAIGYKPGVLPTFVIPPVTIDKLNLVHGSCRKAHGPGKDSLAALDYVIKDAVINNEPEKRPHQLYLTGDQIYADEVPIIMSPHLTALGIELLGINEELKLKKADGTVISVNATQENFPAMRRQKLVQKNANFTSTEAINHLLSFGEFAATYIMYWSNSAWPKELFGEEDDLKDQEDFLSVLDLHPATDSLLDPPDANESEVERTKRLAEEKENLKKKYKDEIVDFIAFRDRLSYVRRVLANVPVFMIMDDHEITDDWYITKDWKDKVLLSPLGVNIIRNGMMAYTLFQDWGNNPDSFSVGGKQNLLSQLQLLFPSGSLSGPNSAATNQIDSLFGFNLNDETPPPIKWHYSVPCSETTVYILDTRTRRTYETRYSRPGLLSNGAMDDQIPLSLQPEKFLIFISPAPVLGLTVFEELLQPAITAFSSFEADPEAWSFYPSVFEKFLNRLQLFKKVILLSGDVHFGFTTTLDYWKKGEASPAKIVQLVSSGLKNQKFSNEQFLIGGMIQKLLGSLLYPGERLGFNSKTGLQVTNPEGKNNPPKLRIRLRKEPVLLPTHGWPEGTTVNQIPDWSWRLQVLKDGRPDDDSPDARPEKIRIESINPDINLNSTNISEEYKKVLQRHVQIFKNGVARVVAWYSNIGMINFEINGGGEIEVTHTLWYWLQSDEDDDEPDAYTVFKCSLDPSSDVSPVIH
jgi:hypothetical protein